MTLYTTDYLEYYLTLVFTALACFLLGMGIPTTAQYIIVSMIAAPALMKWGIHPLISHMFVLFYAVLALFNHYFSPLIYFHSSSCPLRFHRPSCTCPLPLSTRRSFCGCRGCSTLRPALILWNF